MHKQYDRAQIPYQRLLASKAPSPSQAKELALLYQGVNPLELRGRIDAALRELWRMAQPDPRTKAEAAALAKLDLKAKSAW